MDSIHFERVSTKTHVIDFFCVTLIFWCEFCWKVAKSKIDLLAFPAKIEDSIIDFLKKKLMHLFEVRKNILGRYFGALLGVMEHETSVTIVLISSLRSLLLAPLWNFSTFLTCDFLFRSSSCCVDVMENQECFEVESGSRVSFLF